MNHICRLLNLEFPLFQAGMGGVAMPRLAAAVSNEGCGGIVGLYKHTPKEIAALLQETYLLTDRPFGVNLIPEIVDESTLIEQVETILQFSRSRIFFTFFGLPPAVVSTRIKQAGYLLLIQIGTVQSAVQAVQLGADALIVQGYEAGGHHLSQAALEDGLKQILALQLDVPVIAAGGIATGFDFARVGVLGASGCLCGTLFIATQESAAHSIFKERVVAATARETVITDLYEIGWPGRCHRVLSNSAVVQGKALPSTFIGKTQILGKTYLIPRFSAAVPIETTEGTIEQMAMYCGTSCDKINSLRSVAEVVQLFRQQFNGVMTPADTI